MIRYLWTDKEIKWVVHQLHKRIQYQWKRVQCTTNCSKMQVSNSLTWNIHIILLCNVNNIMRTLSFYEINLLDVLSLRFQGSYFIWHMARSGLPRNWMVDARNYPFNIDLWGIKKLYVSEVLFRLWIIFDNSR